MIIKSVHINSILRKSIIIGLLVIFWSNPIQSQTIVNTGKINSIGTISVRRGSVQGMPDTIGGRVEFLDTNRLNQVSIPNVVYNQLVVKNKAKKIILDSKDNFNVVKNLTVRDSLIVDDGAEFTTKWAGLNPEDVHARSTVVNNAAFKGSKYLVMNGYASTQNLIANGTFSKLKIDNPFGVNVQSGGFVVEEQLNLSQGHLNNAADRNFTMADSTQIIRNTAASLSYSPNFSNRVNVRYEGSGNITAGPELPNDTLTLQEMDMDIAGSLALDTNITVNRRLALTGRILTEPDTNRKYTLTLTTAEEPEFNSYRAEIDGRIKRTVLKINQKIYFNNPYTYAIFPDAIAKNGTASLAIRTRVKQYAPFPDGNMKVQRFFRIEARDTNDVLIPSGVTSNFAYGWHWSQIDTAWDETHDLSVPDLILQRYLDNNWNDLTNSTVPVIDTVHGWAYASINGITPYGDFAIGAPGFTKMYIAASVFLEGPYRNGSMVADLRAKELIPLVPPDVYPYNLDPRRLDYRLLYMPDSTVDWVVLEFRSQLTGGTSKYRTALLRTNGAIVDLDGSSPVKLARGGGIDSGDYYIAIRHRNHLAVITQDPIRVYPQSQPVEINFSNPGILLGQMNAVKPLDKHLDNSLLFGLYAGDVNGDGVINDKDYLGVWDKVYDVTDNTADKDNYTVWDLNLSGVLNTRDWNYTWNNLGKVSNVPK